MSQLSNPVTFSQADGDPLLLRAARRFALRPGLKTTALTILKQSFLLHEPLMKFSPGSIRVSGSTTLPSPAGTDLPSILIARFLDEKPWVPGADVQWQGLPGGSPDYLLASHSTLIVSIVNQWAPRLLDFHEQQLVDFWCQASDVQLSPWHWLSRALKVQLHRATQALTDDSARRLVAQVVDYPDSGLRHETLGNDAAQVLLAPPDATRQPMQAAALIIRGRIDGRELRLRFCLGNGIQTLAHTDVQETFQPLPSEVFEAYALTALEAALQAIMQIEPVDFTARSLDAYVERNTRLDALFGTSLELESLRREFDQQLPSWLRGASAMGRLWYSQCLSKIARCSEKSMGNTFAGGVMLDAQVEAAHERQFVRECSWQLWRVALEQQFQGASGMTAQGVQWVRAAVRFYEKDRVAAGVPVGLCSVALSLGPDSPLQTLDGVFMIAALGNQKGPVILCRPRSAQVLHEFTDMAALRNALASPGPLQQSIQAALPVAVADQFASDWGSARSPLVHLGPTLRRHLWHWHELLVRLLGKQAQSESRWPAVSSLWPWFESPLQTLARLKQVGGNLQALDSDTPTAPGWHAEVDQLRNLALRLVYPGIPLADDEIQRRSSQGDEPEPVTLHRVKRMDADWASARRRFSTFQGNKLKGLRRAIGNELLSPILDGPHKGLLDLGGILVFNKDENHFKVLGDNRLNITVQPSISLTVVHPDDSEHRGPRIRREVTGGLDFDWSPRVRRAPQEALSVNALKAMKSGQARKGELPEIVRLARNQAQGVGASRGSPLEMEEKLQAQAERFSQAAGQIRRYTVSRHTAQSEALVNELEQDAGMLQSLGESLRVDMTKTSATPTAADLIYLLNHRAVTIEKLGERVEESIDGVTDYLQEYVVRDVADGHRPLWYAHFHYPRLETAPEAPAKAHLKTVAQRHLGRQFEQAEQQAGRNTRVYRGDLNTPKGRAPFLQVQAAPELKSPT